MRINFEKLTASEKKVATNIILDVLQAKDVVRNKKDVWRREDEEYYEMLKTPACQELYEDMLSEIKKLREDSRKLMNLKFLNDW